MSEKAFIGLLFLLSLIWAALVVGMTFWLS